MKNIYLRRLLFFLIALSLPLSVISQRGVSDWMKEIRKTNTFEKDETIGSTSINRKDNELNSGTTLSIDQNLLQNLWKNSKPAISISVPIFGRPPLELELAKVQVTTSGFKVGTSNGITSAKTDEGIHYRGIIVGDETSIVALSVYQDEIRGFISGKDGSWEIGKTKDAKKEHVAYDTKELSTKQPFACGTNENTIGKNLRMEVADAAASALGVGCKTVTVYFECDYQMYLDNGSNVTNVTNYVTSFFNQVATLYQNENIDIQISQIYVWTTADPYRTLTSTSAVLQAFDTNRGSNFTGTLAHFLTTRNLGGGIAYVGTMCNKAYAHGVSMVYNTFATYPTYSWTVEVVAHELGHNIGSNHTQWCGWTRTDGTVGPLDNCYPIEGTCTTTGATPTNGGTVMSYCHLVGVGINFQNGFGIQPGNTLRANVTNATCLTAAATSAAPTGQQTTNIVTNAATVSWNIVPNATTYTINYKPTSTTTWITAGSSSAATYNLSGLLPGTSYDWQVKGDCSGFSNSTVFTTSGTATCAVPISLATASITANSANLSWAAVSGATNYTVQYKLSTATTWTTVPTLTTTSYSLTGLVASSAYNWQVKANCSAYTANVNFSTIATTCLAPSGLTVTTVSNNGATVMWGAVSGATNYTVQYKLTTATTWTTASTTTNTTLNLTNLNNNKQYNWQVKTNCSINSTGAIFSTGTSSCLAPTGLIASNISGTTATLTWTAVVGATNYTLQYKKSSTTTWTSVNVTGTTYNLTALTGSTTYNWQVKANCSGNSSTFTFNTTNGSCVAPIGLATNQIAATSATLQWAAVVGAANYTIQYKISSSTTWTTTATMTATSYQLTGLLAGNTYNWQVKANCSNYSSVMTFITPAASIANNCLIPANLSTSLIQVDAATASWDAVAGASSYTIQVKKAISLTWTTVSTVSTTNAIIPNLLSNINYQWRVKTNCSNYSSSISFKTAVTTTSFVKPEITQNLENTEISKFDFTIYPNPSSIEIRLKTSEEKEIGGGAFYRIADSRGNIKLIKLISEAEENINISDLQEGIYIIQMVSKSGRIQTKTLVVR